MSAAQLAHVLVKTMGLWTLIQGLYFAAFSAPSLPTIVTGSSGTSGWIPSLVPLSMMIWYLLIGCVLWLRPQWFVDRILEGIAEAEDQAPLPGGPLFFIFLGIWVLIGTAPEIGRNLTYLALSGGDLGFGALAQEQFWANWTALAIKLAIALYLVFGADTLLNFVRRTRNAGVAKPQSD